MHHLLFLAQSHPNLSDRWGYHIRPIHYYEPLPDFRSITLEQIIRRREFPAIDFSWDEQLALLNELTAYRDELSTLEFNFDNGFFSGFDAAVYYSLIRHLKPQRIIEINERFQIALANYWLCLDHVNEAARFWPNALSADYGASSLWMKRMV